VRYAGDPFQSAERVIATSREGNHQVHEAIRTLACYLAQGCATLIHFLDPAMLILSGGLVQANSFLVPDLRDALAELVTVWRHRDVKDKRLDAGRQCGRAGSGCGVCEKMPVAGGDRMTASVPSAGSEGIANAGPIFLDSVAQHWYKRLYHLARYRPI
jgi:predicted NBD/HSP70 family sugar kinase